MKWTFLFVVGLLAPLCSLASATTDPPRLTSEASYQFMLAKLLAEDGELPAASKAFERALGLDPGASYIRLEFAQMLSRWARFQADPDERQATLRRASREVRQASAELDRNADALRAEADVQLALVGEEPDNDAALEAAIAALEGLRRVAPTDLPSLFTLGQVYLRKDRPKEAAEVFESVVATTPGYQPVYPLLAQALLDSGQPERAVEPLRKVIEIQPGNDNARVALAEVLSRGGAHREAVDVLRGAPEGLKAPEARTRLATELYFAGDLEGALAELDGLPPRLAGSRYLRLVRGLVLAGLGHNDDAIEALRPLLTDGGPVEPNVAGTVARLLLREGRSAEAATVLGSLADRLAASGETDRALEVELELARAHAEAREWEAAAGVLARVQAQLAAAGAELAREGRLLAADVALEQGRGAEALALLAPTDRPKRLEILVRQGRSDEAEEELARLSAPGGEEAALLGAIEAFHRAENFAPTIAPLERLSAAQPDSVPIRFLLGSAYERTGQRERAVDTLGRLIELEPDFHPALNYLGYLWIDSGERLDEALELVRRALALNPANGAYLDSLGWGYFRLGRLEEARRELERASRLFVDATIFEHLGDVYRALGERDQARTAYQRARELGAEDPASLGRKLAALDADGDVR